jgi:G:T-mismatch repair DNA endonuclease (very short patch repair protein)
VIRAGNEKDLFKYFIDWLLRDSMQGFSLVAHNGAGFDNPYLFQRLIQDYGLYVDPIYSSSKLLQFVVKRTQHSQEYIFRAIDSLQFFQSALSALPKQFGLDTRDMKKGFFPYMFDKPSNWNYVGHFPDLEFYALREKREGEASDVEKWHIQQEDNVFHFRRDMLDYCLQDVRVLLSAIQVAVKEDLNFMGFDGMAETCTIAAKTMLFFRHSFLKADTIGVIPQDGYGGHRNQSTEGLLWLLLQEADHYPGLQHARSVQGEKVICGSPVDGFHDTSNTVLQYHGCFFHGCSTCYPNGSLKNNVNAQSFDSLRTKTQRRTQKLRDEGFTVVEKWSCEFTADEKQRALALGLGNQVPQLVPKHAFYGGRTEAVTLHSKVETPADEIKYYDVTSEYPFVNARKLYPIGHPSILLKHQLPQTNDDWRAAHLFGAVKCSILPPLRLIHPVLPFKKDGALMFPLCTTCCLEKREDFCAHGNRERMLHGTWMSIEIDKAIEMGYQLVEVNEVWHFSQQTTTLFWDFIKALYKAKLEASGFPSGVDSIEQKRAYVDEIYAHERFAVEINKIDFNPGRRQMAKILLNSFWGKFAQRENLTQVEFLNADLERFNELVFSDNLYSVTFVSPISDDSVYVVYKNLFNKPNPKGNIFIAAFTTAHARLHLYEAMQRLGQRVLYLDTDSVVFQHKKGLWSPKLSNYLGDWTDEIATGSRITDFTTCGPKNYCYLTENALGETKALMKVKGLSLSKQALELLTPDVMLEQVKNFSSRKRKCDDVEEPCAKRPCLLNDQKKALVAQNKRLNDLYIKDGPDACMDSTCSVPSGPCNCTLCATKTSITVPQVQFKKNRRDGFVQTADTKKEYQLVLNKRWLWRELHTLPLGYFTLPFGFQ